MFFNPIIHPQLFLNIVPLFFNFKEFINNLDSEESDEDSDMVDLGNNFCLHKSISSKLYEYQKEGVLWFWKLFQKKQGGILGDDMGYVSFY